MDSFDKKVGIGIVVVIIALVGLFILIPKTQDSSDCSSSQTYDYSSKRCRAKTDSEIKQEKEAAQKKAEADRKAKLAQEIRLKKANGELCLSSTDAWLYADSGKSYCVVFHPSYFYHTGYGLMFINEKEDYRNGFVAPLMKYYMISWDERVARYRVDKIAVTGELVWYEGHPEIKVYDLSQITIPKVYNCETSEGCVYTKN